MYMLCSFVLFEIFVFPQERALPGRGWPCSRLCCCSGCSLCFVARPGIVGVSPHEGRPVEAVRGRHRACSSWGLGCCAPEPGVEPPAPPGVLAAVRQSPELRTSGPPFGTMAKKAGRVGATLLPGWYDVYSRGIRADDHATQAAAVTAALEDGQMLEYEVVDP